jgi:hypothetical protein
VKKVQADRGRLAAIRGGSALPRAAAAALLTLLAFAPVSGQEAVRGDEGLRPRLSFGGFGTLGLIHSGENRADFAENTTRSLGPGHSRSLDTGVDSRIAGQATMFVGSRLTAVLQVMVEQDVAGDYRPHAEWANLSYAFTPDLSLRAGRIVLPAFLVSESRKVSYATPWMRPPVELYGMAPVYSLDGVDATYTRRFGEWTSRLNAAYGRNKSDFPTGTAEADPLWNVNTALARGALTGRLAAGGGTLKLDVLDPLFDGIRAFGPEGIALADRYDTNDRYYQFAGVGFEYDPGPWFTLAEFAWLDLNSALGERVAGYVTGGVRRGAFAPYATYSRTELLSESSVAGLTLSNLPPEYAQAAAELNGVLNAVLNSSPVQHNLAIGGRWDALQNIAFKVQLDFVDVLGNSYGTFINMQPGLAPGGSARLFSVATAFVF